MSKSESLANDSDASDEDRAIAKKLMRKITMASLRNIFSVRYKETEKVYVESGWMEPDSSEIPCDKEEGGVEKKESTEDRKEVVEEVEEELIDEPRYE